MAEKCLKIREYAKRAKQRLRNGYWNKIKNSKEKYIKEHYQEGDNIENLSYMFQKMVEEEIESVSKPKTKDDLLYKKVTKLLSENEYVLNPIMRLIDHEVYDNLSEVAKQNYIYELTDKYNEMKQRFERERKSRAVFNCWCFF